jgi:predicted secreted protein
MKWIVSLFTALMWSQLSQAGTVSTLEQVGFSPNSHYFAFQTSEDNGMSSDICQTTTFLNARTNKWVGRPYRVCQPLSKSEFTQEELQDLDRRSRSAKNNINYLKRKLNISFQKQGSLRVNRAPFRYWKSGGITDKEFSKTSDSATFTGSRGHYYQVSLFKKTLKTGSCDELMYNLPTAIMTLTLQSQSHKARQVLQADRGLPKSRGCPIHYRIEKVYLSPAGKQTVIVVLLQYFTPSIEGPDERYLAVSGVIN